MEEIIIRPPISQIVGAMKICSPGTTRFEPCIGGWLKIWKDSKGRIYSRFKPDDTMGCRMGKRFLEHDPKRITKGY